MNWKKYNPPEDVVRVLDACHSLTIASSVEELSRLATGGADEDCSEVAYEVSGKGRVVEATVARVRNGICVNYPEPYMRRRDPDSMVIADDMATDKPTYRARFNEDFASMRAETLDWLSSQPLLMFAFISGQQGMGTQSLVIAPANAGFFAFALALLQGIIADDDIPDNFSPSSIVYVAPPFRHSHFGGKQVVVHDRSQGRHEVFAYNLYPGPSAKKGIYGILIGQGEREGWVTAHCSTVQVVTPYDNIVTIMHEGASGGGKSEMLEQAHRAADGRLLIGENTVSGEKRYLEIPRSCELRPVTDDMALCHPSLQSGNGKLTVTDAEDAWFLRVNHIDDYGTDVALEKMTAKPTGDLLFLNIDAVAGSRAMIWEHTEDAPGRACPNPRVIVPRQSVANIVNEPVSVDIRSFGVRTPPCTREVPTYGIIGMFHVLSPALGWLWRLVAPRGHANPSITDSEGMTSEGVGSYWPFATGRRVDQANLLLRQIAESPGVRHILTPNQFLGAWKVGFMPQWIAREYLARRGSAKFRPDQLAPSRCPLLGHTPHRLQVEGRMIGGWLMQVETQPEVGEEAYDAGAAILRNFFLECLAKFDDPELDPVGRQIIACCRDNGSAEDYSSLLSPG